MVRARALGYRLHETPGIRSRRLANDEDTIVPLSHLPSRL